jgi:hypothetical protein
MTDLEETLAPAPVPVLTAYVDFLRALDALDDDALDDLGDAHAALRGRTRKHVAIAAQQAADLAYDSGRIAMTDDVGAGTVVGLTGADSDIAGTLLDRAGGVAIIVGLAVLVHDELDPATLDTITGWWTAAGGPLPAALHPAGPAEAPAAAPARPASPVATGGRRRVIPPPAPTTPPAQRRTTAPAPRQAQTRRVRGRSDGTLALLGMLMVFGPAGALVALGLAFFHASMADGTSARWLAVVATLIVATVVAAAARRHILSRRK